MTRWMITVVAMLAMLHTHVRAQSPEPKGPKKAPAPKLLTSQLDAIAIADADSKNIQEEDRGCVLYVWNRSGDWEAVQACALVANYVSRSSAPARLDLTVDPLDPLPGVYPLAGGKVLRINLREFVETDDELRELLLLREELRFDPSFARLITRDAIDLLRRDPERARQFFGGDVPIRKVHESKWTWDPTINDTYRDPTTGRVHRGGWREEKIVRTVSVLEVNEDAIRTNARVLDRPLRVLQDRLGTEAPIVEASYFVARFTSGIKGKGLYRTVYGGLYTDLIGLRRSKTKGVTDEDLLFEDLITGGAAKVKAKDVFDRQRSDRKLAMERSNVTGSPRRVDWIPVTTRGDGPSVAFVTGDPSSEDVDVGAHPIVNLRLLESRVKAREWLWKNSFGLDRAALTDAVKGELQEKAPPDVVSDSEVPQPYTRELDSGIISCGRCHGKGVRDGWQPMVNDVQRLYKSGLDVFGEIRDDHERKLFDEAKRLRGQYQGNADQTLKVLRDDNALVVLRITGPWKKSKGQTDVFRLAWERISDLFAEQRYQMVDAQLALRRLGVEVEKAQAAKMLDQLVRPSRFENPLIRQLRLGEILPNSWNLIQEELMWQAAPGIAKLSKGDDK